MSERDVESEVGEWIRLRVALVCERPVERERDFVPLLEFASDGDLAFAVGLTRGDLRLTVSHLGNGPNERDAGV